MTKARDLANASTALSAVSATELAFVDGVTSAIQTQMDAKAPSSTAVTLTGTQTLTNKTLTSPVIASVVNNTLTSTTGDIIYASAANTPARLGIGTTGQILNVAAGLPAWATAASSVPTVNWVRLTSGISWNVPATIKSATIWTIAGGGGGGSARGDGNKYGGGAGGAGGIQNGTFDLSSVAGGTISYAIGAAGSGGVQTTGAGNNGANGGNTTFGTALQAWYLSATGGGYGKGGNGQGNSGGCGGGNGGAISSGAAGGGGGGIGGNGDSARSVVSTDSMTHGTQGGSGGYGGSGGTNGNVAGLGGLGMFINNYGVGGGGVGGCLQGNNFTNGSTIFGAAQSNAGADANNSSSNTGAGGAGGTNGTANNTGYSGGNGGSGVIFIQYLS